MNLVSNKDGDVTHEAQRVMTALGDELRLHRKRLGLTRKQVVSRSSQELSWQSLGGYELGIRRCSVERLFDICLALDVKPQDVISRVYQRVYADTPRGWYLLDVAEAVRNGHPQLGPLRRWAHSRMQAGGERAVRLTFPALAELAGLCGIDTADLIALLGSEGIRQLDTPADDAELYDGGDD